MEKKWIINALSALAHETRLAVFRDLVVAGPAGRTPGRLGKKLGIPGATLSFHLQHLVQAGLVEAAREGRSIRYTARYSAMDEVIAYLTENCCADSDCGSAQCDT